MRWKLLMLVSFVAAILAVGLWSAITIAIFGSARVMAQNDWFLLSSLVIPLGVTAYTAVFVYRHTSRRRKTQALITAVLALFFAGAIYLIASQIFGQRLIIPRTYEVRHAR